LPLAEQAVLAMLSERPAHGFAIARLTARGGELGRIWHIPRPVVYRSIGRLLDAGLITPAAVESGRGPQRTIYTVTAQGRQAAARWLDTPVEHVRDVRSQLLIKLALLDRTGTDATALLLRQKAILQPIASAVATERPQRKGFDAAWPRFAAQLPRTVDVGRERPGAQFRGRKRADSGTPTSLTIAAVVYTIVVVRQQSYRSL